MDTLTPDRLRLVQDQMTVAVARLRQARDDVAELDRVEHDGLAKDMFTNLAVDAMHLAENRLMAAILSLADFDGFNAMKAARRRWPARAVRWAGRYYLTFPVEEDADSEIDQMTLFEIDADAVVDLGWPGEPNEAASPPGPSTPADDRRKALA